MTIDHTTLDAPPPAPTLDLDLTTGDTITYPDPARDPFQPPTLHQQRIADLTREVSRLSTKVSDLIAQHAQETRRIHAAARADAWKRCLSAVQHLARRVDTPHLAELLHRAQQLGSRPRAQDVERVRHLASEVARHRAETTVEAKLSPLLDEMKRLRDAVTHQGHRLHQQLGHDSTGPCLCPGCELIRSIDQVDEPRTSSAA